jgi:hypothetical protein
MDEVRVHCGGGWMTVCCADDCAEEWVHVWIISVGGGCVDQGWDQWVVWMRGSGGCVDQGWMCGSRVMGVCVNVWI